MSTPEKSCVFSFVLLCIFFFFGVFKDALNGIDPLRYFSSYRFLIPTLLIVVFLLGAAIRKKNSSFRKPAILFFCIVVVNLAVEFAFFTYNIIGARDHLQDFGDRDHQLIRGINLSDNIQKPDVFWIVLDEYSSSDVLKQRWNFSNPLDTILKNKGFFVADEAASPYNYTQYSLVSTLDMKYIDELDTGSIIRHRDIIRGLYSMKRNNVVSLFEEAGYKIHNYSISDMENKPASPFSRFRIDPAMLIDNQTISGRMTLDIGWGLPFLLTPGKTRDSIIVTDVYRNLKSINDSLLDVSMKAITSGALSSQPSLYMLHMMFSHDPFIYDADGELNIQPRLGIMPDRYIPTLQYTNVVIDKMIDSIMKMYKDREVVILLQGDHGFKFDEADPMYRSSMCKIMYAVYCSDQNYSGWSSSTNSVNSFRILFNKYFNTVFPMLPEKSYHLYYR